VRNSDASPLDSLDSDELDNLVQTVWSAAQHRQGDCLALLDLLRRLERLHHDIRDTLFCDALPENRQRLYRLLKDIEQEGGWPYIQRMQLLSLVDKLEEDNAAESTEEALNE